MSQQVYDYLMLYTVTIGITKSMLVRELIENWVRLQSKSDPEENLIKLVSEKILTDWKMEKAKNPTLFTEEYLIRLNKELRSKGVAMKHIEIIIEKIKDGKNKIS